MPPYFLVLQVAPLSSRIFPVPVLEAAIPPRSPGSFYWGAGFKQDLGAHPACYQWCVLASGPLSWRRGGTGGCTLTPRVPQSCLSVGANQEFTSMTLILILSVLIILASSPRGSKASPPAWQTWLPLSPRPPFGSSAADQCVVESEVNPCPRPRPQAPAAASGPGLMHSPFCL